MSLTERLGRSSKTYLAQLGRVSLLTFFRASKESEAPAGARPGKPSVQKLGEVENNLSYWILAFAGVTGKGEIQEERSNKQFMLRTNILQQPPQCQRLNRLMQQHYLMLLTPNFQRRITHCTDHN